MTALNPKSLTYWTLQYDLADPKKIVPDSKRAKDEKFDRNMGVISDEWDPEAWHKCYNDGLDPFNWGEMFAAVIRDPALRKIAHRSHRHMKQMLGKWMEENQLDDDFGQIEKSAMRKIDGLKTGA